MDHVVWDDSMSVGVGILDTDHKRLLEMFNGLLKTGVSTKSKDDLIPLIEGLRDYTNVHFRREEAFMERHGFPDLETHKAAHRYFVDEVEKLAGELNGDHTMMLRIDLILLLKEWLIEHIQTTDKQYQPYLASEDAASAG
ncbi:bacteriohemerythrin [Azospirillum sp. TSO22-1]|uniref:bacteriohemerythrin n=1 Tax=Azospirillum sp. TSO22-1 TaxID=716789 RepID=UPI000D612E8D|nr:bacteriohemerythrin [Azospirillum sp. TSO22-1]PWC52343.1 hemerythrin [Azospirillum sp. TSO22-1]